MHRYNEEGIDGLKSRRSPGLAPLLTAAQKAKLKVPMMAGSGPQFHKVVRWRCVDLRAEIARRLSVVVHESTVGTWLHELGLNPAATSALSSEEDAEVAWTHAGSRRFPGDPSYAFALLQDPGRAGKISPWRSCRCCPRDTHAEGLSFGTHIEANTRLQHPLSTLHERRRRRPCKTPFRLAG
jgi:transposase